MKAPLALVAAATLFGCSSGGSAPLNGPDAGGNGLPGAAGTSGGAGTSGAGDMAGTGGADDGGVGPGAAGASGPDGGVAPLGLCPSRAGRQLDQPALMGYDGADFVFVREDGVVTRVRGPGSRKNMVLQRNGWLAASDADATTNWKAQLYDSAGTLRAESSGEGARIGLWHLLSDGTAIFGLPGPAGAVILTPDGRARRRPFFSEQPDAEGWVATTVPEGTLGGVAPVMLNLETGEVRRLSLPSSSGQVVSGARYLYLAQVEGKTLLVDESPAAIRKVEVPASLPALQLALEVQAFKLSDGRQTAYLTHSSGGERVPVWIYDVATGSLASAMPDGVVPDDTLAVSYYTDRLAIGAGKQPLLGGPLVWTVDLATGSVLDQRTGLTVRKTRPAPGGAPQWLAVNGNGSAKQVYRYDRSSGAVEDLHVAGDLTLAGRYALVTRDQRPLAAVDVESGKVTPIPGGETLPIGLTQANGRWAVGYSEIAGKPYAPGVPLWRVDLQAGTVETFARADAPLVALGTSAAGPFGYADSALLPDGRVGVTLYDGIGLGLYLGEPGAPWRPLGHRVREAQRFRWAAGSSAVTLSADKACDCYGPLMLAWPAPPAGAPVPLSGSSVQILALDGTEAFAPRVGEEVVGFADATNSCALVRNAAREWFVYDAQARTRRSLGKAESLAWVTP